MEATVDSVQEEKTITGYEKIKVVEALETQGEIYPVQDLIDNCEALGYKKEVVTGAFYNCEKTDMTKNEFKERIKNFLRKQVE